jgi:hypothetical protein
MRTWDDYLCNHRPCPGRHRLLRPAPPGVGHQLSQPLPACRFATVHTLILATPADIAFAMGIANKAFIDLHQIPAIKPEYAFYIKRMNGAMLDSICIKSTHYR